MCAAGLVLLGAVAAEVVFAEARHEAGLPLMGALAIFSGAQLLMLGLIGEYVGRAFPDRGRAPQAIVGCGDDQGGIRMIEPMAIRETAVGG